ncbi:thioesterase family protein [Polaribacter aestuariivivens]|uniref:thioesterase family protein n=1 Tax=Polaribacter aestuariivivens TaxID=2304626 RepID=UPI003F49A7ED
MFQRNYKVKGEDVNDFMVMQNSAYLKYASIVMETFLFVNGFTKLKMNNLKVGLQKNNDQIIQQKQLLFTQPFITKLELKSLGVCEQKMSIAVHFFNEKEELCTTVYREIYWFDYTSWEVITPPKTIAKYFIEKQKLGKVS